MVTLINKHVNFTCVVIINVNCIHLNYIYIYLFIGECFLSPLKNLVLIRHTLLVKRFFIESY